MSRGDSLGRGFLVAPSRSGPQLLGVATAPAGPMDIGFIAVGERNWLGDADEIPYGA